MVEEELLEELEESKNEIYKCPSCGANLIYKPETQSLYCEYCDYTLALEGTHSTEENDFFNTIKSTINNDEVKKASCKNCGAVIIIDKQDITTKCPFCDTSIVLAIDEINGLKPDRVIPFKIDDKFDLCIQNKDDYRPHYGEFEGSYAQDVMGYSDDVINDAFEGDPDNYWNID